MNFFTRQPVRDSTTTDRASINSWPPLLRSSGLIFAAAFLIRIIFFLVLLHHSGIKHFWYTGFEVCHIAASLISGHGFSSPFGVPTGPTAWVPPAYVAIVAFVFKVFGSYSPSAMWVMLSLNAFCAAFTALAVRRVGEIIFSARVGIASAWIWALSAYAVRLSIKIWESSLSALLVVAGVLLYEYLRNSSSTRNWIVWGVFWGCAALVNPALAVFFPILSIGLIWRNRRGALPRLTLAATLFTAIIVPWIVRNQLQMHKPFPIRSNFGEELWLGNHVGVLGPNDETRQPLGDPRELSAYRDLGERNFVTEKQRAAMTFIRDHPGEFIHLTFIRIIFFWSSPEGSWWPIISLFSFAGVVLAIRQDLFRALPFMIALVLYPCVYYITHSDNWYRYPIEPMMVLLAVHALLSIVTRLRSSLRARGFLQLK